LFIRNFIVGKTFSIREFSVIAPAFIGTLKSTLNKTLFPSMLRLSSNRFI